MTEFVTQIFSQQKQGVLKACQPYTRASPEKARARERQLCKGRSVLFWAGKHNSNEANNTQSTGTAQSHFPLLGFITVTVVTGQLEIHGWRCTWISVQAQPRRVLDDLQQATELPSFYT